MSSHLSKSKRGSKRLNELRNAELIGRDEELVDILKLVQSDFSYEAMTAGGASEQVAQIMDAGFKTLVDALGELGHRPAHVRVQSIAAVLAKGATHEQVAQGIAEGRTLLKTLIESKKDPE